MLCLLLSHFSMQNPSSHPSPPPSLPPSLFSYLEGILGHGVENVKQRLLRKLPEVG